jgi:hypothetical protein
MEEIQKDIENETRVFQTLGANGGHENVILALKHGRLDEDRYYFDMELCILNLADYISGDIKSIYGLSKYIDPKSGLEDLGCLSMWGIINQITDGLAYIHSHNQFHRDLKPQNGIPFPGVVAKSSPPIDPQSCLENFRFWIYVRGNLKNGLYDANLSRYTWIQSPRAAQRDELRRHQEQRYVGTRMHSL